MEKKLKLDTIGIDDEGREWMEEDGMPDGIFFELRRRDGHGVEYSDGMRPDDKERCTGIGIREDGHAFVVGLRDLRDEDGNTEMEFVTGDGGRRLFFFVSDAIEDFDAEAATEELCCVLDPKVSLAEGETIPTFGMLVRMNENKERLNEALRSVGGEELGAGWYLSSTRFSASHVWCVNHSYDGRYVLFFVK